MIDRRAFISSAVAAVAGAALPKMEAEHSGSSQFTITRQGPVTWTAPDGWRVAFIEEEPTPLGIRYMVWLERTRNANFTPSPQR